MQHHVTSLQALADAESATEQRRAVMDVLVLLLILTLAGLFAVQSMQIRADDAGLLVSWAVITAPAVVAWCLKPARPTLS